MDALVHECHPRGSLLTALACTPTDSLHPWYEYRQGRTRTVEDELESIFDGAPTMLRRVEWRSAIKARIEVARRGSVPREKDAVERLHVADAVYELKIPLDMNSEPPELARLYQVDLSWDGAPTIGCFRASRKLIFQEDHATRSAQNSDIREASDRFERLCRTEPVERLTSSTEGDA